MKLFGPFLTLNHCTKPVVVERHWYIVLGAVVQHTILRNLGKRKPMVLLTAAVAPLDSVLDSEPNEVIETLADSNSESGYDRDFEGFNFKLSGDENHTDVLTNLTIH